MDEPQGGLAVREHLTPEVMEQVVIGGDLVALDAGQRLAYYQAVCQSLHLNPLTKPFEYLLLNGKLRLYALRDCTDQLRRLHQISIRLTRPAVVEGLSLVVAQATTPDGRSDESTGVVATAGLKGEALANALMKAETKAKRRVTLSIAGLGWLDETEVDGLGLGPREGAASTGIHPSGDQIASLVEMARACGVDRRRFGQHLRRLMDLAEEVKITPKLLRETMTMAQYEAAWGHYQALLKQSVEAELDDVPLGDEAEGSDPPAKAVAGTQARGGRPLTCVIPLPDGSMFDVAGQVAPLPWVGEASLVSAAWLRVLQSRADVLRTVAVWRQLKAKYPRMTARQFADCWLVLGQQTAS